MDELDDQQGRRPRHNESASEVSHDEVGPQCDVGDEGGGGELFGTHGRGMILCGLLTTRGNKIWEGTTMGPRELFKSKSLSHVGSINSIKHFILIIFN